MQADLKATEKIETIQAMLGQRKVPRALVRQVKLFFKNQLKTRVEGCEAREASHSQGTNSFIQL